MNRHWLIEPPVLCTNGTLRHEHAAAHFTQIQPRRAISHRRSSFPYRTAWVKIGSAGLGDAGVDLRALPVDAYCSHRALVAAPLAER